MSPQRSSEQATAGWNLNKPKARLGNFSLSLTYTCYFGKEKFWSGRTRQQQWKMQRDPREMSNSKRGGCRQKLGLRKPGDLPISVSQARS